MVSALKTQLWLNRHQQQRSNIMNSFQDSLDDEMKKRQTDSEETPLSDKGKPSLPLGWLVGQD